MALVIPNPAGCEWPLWAETVVGYSDDLHNQLSPSMDWVDFATRLSLIVPNAPRPDLFDTWQDWGVALLRSQAG